MSNNNLQRFLDAQENDYEVALAEVRQGRKRSHWMWYIFPQIYGLGSSDTSKYYAIKDGGEAAMFLHHPVLGTRLVTICNALLSLDEHDPYKIFGSPDDMKLRSSLTLFSTLPGAPPVFDALIKKLFKGKPDDKTLFILGYKP